MANRLLKYNSQSDYEAAKGSLLIPYVAIYPSTIDGKTVVVYANADGTNTSEVIATAQLTNLINDLSNELDGLGLSVVNGQLCVTYNSCLYE